MGHARRSACWFGLLLGLSAAALVGLQGNAYAATTTCGQRPTGSNDVSRATLTAAPASATTDLGNDAGGVRQIGIDVTADGQCTLPNHIPVTFGVFAGKFADLDNRGALSSTDSVDGNVVHVVVTVHRANLPPGSYTGTVRVGNGAIGAATAQLTVTRQAPLFWVPLLLGILAMIGGVMLAGLRRLYGERGAGTARPVTLARAKSFANARARVAAGDTKKQYRSKAWQGLLAGMLPIETAIRVGAHMIANLFSIQHVWPVLVGLGAAVTAFVATYSNDPSWSFGLASAVTLLSKVGGAALAGSFATWQAADHAAAA